MFDSFSLPGMIIKKKYPDDTALFVLGGRAPSVEWLKQVDFQTETWAVDRGVDVCVASGIAPSILIGDADSATPASWTYALKNGAEVLKFKKDKDYTDFQLALAEISKRRTEHKPGVFLTGCWGGRFDHLYSLVFSFVNTSEIDPVGMADENEGMIFLNGPSEAVLKFKNKPVSISLICFSKKCQGVLVEGTKWNLSKALMNFETTNFISNRLADNSSCVKISVDNGLLGLYWSMLS